MTEITQLGIILIVDTEDVEVAKKISQAAAAAHIQGVSVPAVPELSSVTTEQISENQIPIFPWEKAFPAITETNRDTIAIRLDSATAQTVDAQDLKKLWKDLLSFSVAHVGINTEDTAGARNLADNLANIFALPTTEFEGAFFVGDMVEVLKGKFLGTKGHIAINTPRPEVAEGYLASTGIAFNEETRAVDSDGKLTIIYLQEEIGGFAWHLRANRSK